MKGGEIGKGEGKRDWTRGTGRWRNWKRGKISKWRGWRKEEKMLARYKNNLRRGAKERRTKGEEAQKKK